MARGTEVERPPPAVALAGEKMYALLVLQNAVFDPHLLERAKAGLRIDASEART